MARKYQHTSRASKGYPFCGIAGQRGPLGPQPANCLTGAGANFLQNVGEMVNNALVAIEEDNNESLAGVLRPINFMLTKGDKKRVLPDEKNVELINRFSNVRLLSRRNGRPFASFRRASSKCLPLSKRSMSSCSATGAANRKVSVDGYFRRPIP